MKSFHLNNIKLRNKLLIVYFLSVFLPILLTNIIFYNVTVKHVKTQKLHDLSLTLDQMTNEFLQNVDDAVGVSAILYSDSTLYSFLERQYETPVDFILAYNSYYRDINKYVPIYSSIQSITVYTDNETVIFAGGIHRINPTIMSMSWYKKSLETNGLYPVLSRTEGSSGYEDQFSIIRSLQYTTENSTEKIIKIDLNLATIEDTFKNVTFQGDVYLVNEHDQIEYTTNPDVDWREGKIPFSKVSIPKDSYVLDKEYSPQYLSDWKVIGVASEKEILEEIVNSRKFIFYLAISNFVVPSLVIIYITGSLHFRLSRIVRHMRKMEKQDFAQIEGVQYYDEIGVLTNEFNRMSKKIKDLIQDVYIADIQKKDLQLRSKQAQLSALQSQINPHFLFNVLETIRMRSLLKGENETAHIIQQMAKLLRTSFIWGKDWVTVEEEINLIRSFLEIQQYRFDDKMQFEIRVDESLNDYIIPNMSLIPFVENASIHGLEACKHKGEIIISIIKVDDRLICRVEDNGVGMDEEYLRHLMDTISTENMSGESVGIRNVYYRLKLHYNSSFFFDFTSTKGKGTVVTISVPADK